MNASSERRLIRILHLILSIPILGYLYGPVASIPSASRFTRWVAMPAVIVSGLWLWLKPRLFRVVRQRHPHSFSKRRSGQGKRFLTFNTYVRIMCPCSIPFAKIFSKPDSR